MFLDYPMDMDTSDNLPPFPASLDRRAKIVLAWDLHGHGMNTSQIARHLEVHRETVGLWLKAVEEQGLLPFLEQHHQAKRLPHPARQVPMSVKQKVWQIREREEQCCGQKIAYFLESEHGVKLSVPKIYEILSEKYKLRSKWKKNKPRGEAPQAEAAREVVQMDSIDFGKVFAFTAVDIFSREADVYLAPALTSEEGKTFLRLCMTRRFVPGHVQIVQTDGGSEFEGRFAEAVGGYCDRHRVARPYKKNEQAHIESFNRTVRKECLGWLKYQPSDIPSLTSDVTRFLERYHYHRPHMAFQPMRPPLQR